MNIRTILFATFLGSSLAAPAGFANGHDYYVFDGKPVEMTRLPDSEYAAFIVPETILATIGNTVTSESAFSFTTVFEARDGYGTILIRKMDDKINSNFQTSVRLLQERLPAGSKVPAYLVDETIMMPTKVATIEFVRDYRKILGDANLIQYLNDNLPVDDGKLPTRDESRGKRPRFKVPFRTLTTETAFPAINALNARPEILAAWPNFMRLVPAPISANFEASESGGSSGLPPSIWESCTESPASGSPDDNIYDKLWPLNNVGASNPQSTQCQHKNQCESTNVADGCCDADIDWQEAWNLAQSATALEETTIAILDVGIQRHIDLDLTIPGIDATVTNPNQNGIWEPVERTQKHGTRVAGIAGAIADNGEGVTGAALATKLLSVRIAEPDAHGNWPLPFGVAGDGIRGAALAGARVLNNSWWRAPEDPDVLTELLDSGIAHDILFVVAAGNMGSDSCNEVNGVNECPSPAIMFPATLATNANRCISDRIIAVTATTQRDEFKTLPNYENAPSYGSSTAGLTDWGSRHGQGVSLAAPGTLRCTTETDPQNDVSERYALFSQTSAAAPVVSGAAAAILSLHPDATAPQLKRWMLTTADPGAGQDINPLTNRPVPDQYFGHGRLNLDAALRRANIEMNILSPRPPRLGVHLYVERQHRRIRNREERHVLVRVMQAGASGNPVPVVDEQIKITTSGWLGRIPFQLIAPNILRTDCDGLAEIQIRGSSPYYWTGALTVSTGTDTATQRISVPVLPLWSWLVLGALIFLTLVGSRQRHVG